MTSNLEQFNREVNEFAKSIGVKVSSLQKKIVLEALRRIVMKTPVDTGRARGNWQVTISSPSEKVMPNTFDKGGTETIQKALTVIEAIPPYSVVWISNNVNYITFLEEGSSQQAPSGMVALTVEELRQMFKDAK